MALRAVILLGFMLVSALQQGAHAEVQGMGHEASTQRVEQHASASHTEAHSHVKALADHEKAASAADDHGDPGGQLCKVHCAPCPALLTNWQLAAPALAPCYGATRVTGLSPGEVPSLQRPPRA